MVLITIIGVQVDPVDCGDDADTRAVKEELANAFGRGVLKQNNKLVLMDRLFGEGFEYFITPQQSKKHRRIHS